MKDAALAHPTLPPNIKRNIVAEAERMMALAAKQTWTFVMISPEQNAAVVNWLHKESRHPSVGPVIWAQLFTALDWEGNVRLTRHQIAELAGTPVDNVSRIMGQLRKIGAVTIHREAIPGLPGPGKVVYRLNPNVATKLPAEERKIAQADAPGLELRPKARGRRLHVVKVESAPAE